MEDLLNNILKKGDADPLLKWMLEQPKDELMSVVKNQSIPVMINGVTCNLRGIMALAYFLKDDWLTELFSEDILQLYIEAGCDINETCSLPPTRRVRAGFTPLLLAIEMQKFSIISWMIDLGADVNKPDLSGYTPLHWSAFAADNLPTGFVIDLMEGGADANKFTEDDDGAVIVPPVLHIAVDEGRVTTVGCLLNNGVDINTEAGYKVLSESHWAALSSRYDCGDMQEHVVLKKISAVGRAVRMRKINVLELLLRNPKAKVSQDELNFCILEGDSKVANILLKHVSHPELAQHKINGRWALHCLGKAAFGQSRFCQFPLEETARLIKTYVKNGFDINQIPLEEKETLAKLFYQNTLHAMMATSNYQTPPYSIEHDSVMIINDLLGKGLDVSDLSIAFVIIKNKCYANSWLMDSQALDTLPKLWWAGAEVDFHYLKYMLSLRKVWGELESEADLKHEKWVRSGPELNYSLKRLAAIAVRKSLTTPQSLHLLTSPVLPTRKIIEYVTQVPAFKLPVSEANE